MSTYFDHLAAAREVQFAMQLSREQMIANRDLLPPAELLGTDFSPNETDAATLARRAIAQLTAHRDFWQAENPFAPRDAGEGTATSPLIYGVGNRAPLTKLVHQPGIIVTGPRRPAASTTTRIQQIAEELASADVPLIAGLSNGVESTALQIYLRLAPHLVTLILGSSPLIAYPVNQRVIHKQAIDAGCAVVSRVPHPAKPIQHSEHLRELTRIPLARAALVAETRPAPSTVAAFIETATTQGLPLFTIGPSEQVPQLHRPAFPIWKAPTDFTHLPARPST